MLKSEAMILPSIWLASASPRRQEMLAWLGISFQIRSMDIDEQERPQESPRAYVERLAEEKAAAASARVKSTSAEVLVLAADTTVFLENQIFGKPKDSNEAISMLRILRGKQHQVITSLVLLDLAHDLKSVENCTTNVKMRNYSDDEILQYVRSGDPLDKAGGYAIQHSQFNPVIDFSGCFASVMGLPMCHLERNLRKYQAYAPKPLGDICQKFLDYTCPIHLRILNGENIG